MIGERLKHIRKEKKVRQEDLAKAIGVKKSTISLYETNRTNPNDMLKVEIAKYFNISLDYLMGVVDEPIPYYKKGSFIILPENFPEDDCNYINELIEFIRFKKKL